MSGVPPQQLVSPYVCLVYPNTGFVEHSDFSKYIFARDLTDKWNYLGFEEKLENIKIDLL